MIDVIVPVARPHKLAALLESLRGSQRDVELIPYLVVSRSDVQSLRVCRESGVRFGVSRTDLGPGDFIAKIDLGYKETGSPWIFQAAEDVEFTPGWAEEALATAAARSALVVGTNDGFNPAVVKGNHSTHTLIARSYCDSPGASMDGPGTVFSREYRHQFCDNELIGVAKSRGVWAFARGALVRHNHPCWGHVETDAIYELGNSFFEQDRLIFNRRRVMWTRGNRRQPASVGTGLPGNPNDRVGKVRRHVRGSIRLP